MLISRLQIFLSKVTSWQKVIIGMVLGVTYGLLNPAAAVKLEFLGIIFIHLIKMITVPMIFLTLIYGITSFESHRGLYRISLKAIMTFLTTAAFAVTIGLICATIIKPGLNEGDIKVVEMLQKAKQNFSDSSNPTSHPKDLLSILIDIIPTNIFHSFAEGNILQVIIFAMFLGSVMNIKRDQCENLIAICHQGAQLMFKMIEIIMRLAPIGVFGYIAALIGSEGLSVILILGKLIITIFTGCLIQYLFFGILLMVWGRLSPLPFYKKILGPQLIAFSTSSSKATLVPMMKVVENDMGVSRQSSRFILPLSSALNMDGGAIYQASCAIFFSQLLGVQLIWVDYITLTILCTIASIGGAGIPGGVLLFLGMVLTSIGVPIEGVLLIASIDRILDMVTTVINITGDACVTVLIDQSEGKLDTNTYNS